MIPCIPMLLAWLKDHKTQLFFGTYSCEYDIFPNLTNHSWDQNSISTQLGYYSFDALLGKGALGSLIYFREHVPNQIDHQMKTNDSPL